MSREIGVSTKWIALLGKPLTHTFAPQIQNEAFEAEGLDYCYYPAEVGVEELPAVLAAVRGLNYAGLVITKPNKVAVCRLLDQVDPAAAAMGSVNTVVKTPEGRLIGYNTDGLACVQSLREDAGVQVEQETFFCIGAGGVGRAIAYTLASCGAKRIYLTDVNWEAAEKLRDTLEEQYPGVIRVIPPQQEKDIFAASGESGVVMNLTGLGIQGGEDRMPYDGRLFRPGQLAFEAAYNPPKTRFLQEAERHGCRILNGLNMTVYQGAIGFQLHTGRPAPLGQMLQTARRLQTERGENR